jgi:hypothetical protein
MSFFFRGGDSSVKVIEEFSVEEMKLTGGMEEAGCHRGCQVAPVTSGQASVGRCTHATSAC